MCGLAGVLGTKLMLGDITKFKDMFTFAQVRGDDGSGVLTVPDTSRTIEPKDIKVRRTTWSSGHLVTTSDFADTVKNDVSIIVGHARMPTKGGSKIENVHPHRNGDVWLVHNGTMSHIDGTAIKDGESDSRMIAKAIYTKGIHEFVQNSFGAYCLIWIDLRDQTINFLRNSQRPLWICDEHLTNMPGSPIDRVWWASECWMIATAKSRYHGYNKDRLNYYELPTNTMFSYPLDMSSLKPTITTVEKKYSSQSSYYSGAEYSGFWMRDWEEEYTSPKKTEDKSEVNGSKVVKFSYVPPEKRHTVIKAEDIFIRSKLDAMRNLNARKVLEAQKGGGTDKSGGFPFDYYRCKDIHRIKGFIDSGPCVWCNSTPVLTTSTKGETTVPSIYPVRFAEDRKDYVCVECISNLDVQKMVGIAG